DHTRRSGVTRKTPAPDIGDGPDWQEKRGPRIASCRPSVTKTPASRRPGPWAGRFVPRIRPPGHPRRPRDRQGPGPGESRPESGTEPFSEYPAANETRGRAGPEPVRQARVTEQARYPW